MNRLVIPLLLISLSGCHQTQYYQRSFPLMGTYVKIKVEDSAQSKKAVKKTIERMKELELKFNRFDPKSEVSNINIGKKIITSEDFNNVMNLSIYLNKITKGAFNVKFGRGRTVLDFGAVAKGYIVDEAVKTLKKYGIKSAIVDAGGDMFCLGENNGMPWNVGIRDPKKKKGIAARLKLRNKALATSGEYETDYRHIVDPRTDGTVKSNVLSATVISDNAALSDGLATAFFILKSEESIALAEALEGVDCVIIVKDNEEIKFFISSDIMESVEIM